MLKFHIHHNILTETLIENEFGYVRLWYGVLKAAQTGLRCKIADP